MALGFNDDDALEVEVAAFMTVLIVLVDKLFNFNFFFLLELPALDGDYDTDDDIITNDCDDLFIPFEFNIIPFNTVADDNDDDEVLTIDVLLPLLLPLLLLILLLDVYDTNDDDVNTTRSLTLIRLILTIMVDGASLVMMRRIETLSIDN